MSEQTTTAWQEFLQEHDELVPCHILDDTDKPLCGAELVNGAATAHSVEDCAELGHDRCFACLTIDDYLDRRHGEDVDDA